MHGVDAAIHVRTGSLACLRINMHPAAGEPFLKHPLVVPAQWRGGRQCQHLGLVYVERAIRSNQGWIDVVVVEIVEAEHPLAQPKIPV